MKSINKSMNNKNDERYTPPILVEPILKYIKPNSTIWCPFDTENSEFVLILKEAGHNVIYSHIDLGQDFFDYEPIEKYDYIISNPPFSRKLDILNRLYKLNKPFAMLMNIERITIVNCRQICRNILPKDLMFYRLFQFREA